RPEGDEKWFLENEKTVTQFCRKLAAERPLKDIRDEYNYPKKKGIKDECSRLLEAILHLGNLFLIVQLHFSKLFLILKSGVNHTSRGSISTSTLPSIKLRKCSSKIITSILSF